MRVLPPIAWERVIEEGQQAAGASSSRFMLTATSRTMHVKFSFASGGEARHAPANELLGNRILQAFGLERPPLAVIEVPATLSAAIPDLPALASRLAFGVELMRGATDAGGPLISVSAARTPPANVLLQFAALTWLQNGDHESHNFMEHNGRLVVIDFAASPADATWGGDGLTNSRPNHGSLQDMLSELPTEVRSDAKATFLSVDTPMLKAITDEIPADWATDEERKHIVAELVRAQKEVADDCF